MSNLILVSFWSFLCLTVCSGTTTTDGTTTHRPRMTGGWTDLDINQSNVKNVTHFAVDMYNKQSNAINMRQLVTIKSAKSQVVAGFKFIIVFSVGETNCSKNGIQRNNHNECPVTNTSTSETCTATIWERSWLKSTQLLDLKCCPSDRTDC